MPRNGDWRIADVYAFGVYFNGSGPVDSLTVTFYRYQQGLPGAVVTTRTVPNSSDSDDGFLVAQFNPKQRVLLGSVATSAPSRPT